MDLRDRRVAGEHLARVLVHERIDLRVGRAVAQHLEDRRGEQHVPVVAQLHHQGAVHGVGIDRVGDHGRKTIIHRLR
ncbi:MAG: hypothetical protein ACXWBU_13040 [Usitatibacter sp.]